MWKYGLVEAFPFSDVGFSFPLLAARMTGAGLTDYLMLNRVSGGYIYTFLITGDDTITFDRSFVVRPITNHFPYGWAVEPDQPPP